MHSTHSGSGRRLSPSAHTSQPWRLHELTADFRLEDVWCLPTSGARGDFPRLVRLIANFDPERSSSRLVRALFALRWRVGSCLGWDRPATGIGARVPTLRERIPDDLRAASPPPDSGELPFSSLYLTEDEWAMEIANQTVHGVLHLGWVPDGAGGYRGQLAVLVKPNGALGRLYMTAITPLRHLIVYPTIMRDIAERWRAPAGPAGGCRTGCTRSM